MKTLVLGERAIESLVSTCGYPIDSIEPQELLRAGGSSSLFTRLSKSRPVLGSSRNSCSRSGFTTAYATPSPTARVDARSCVSRRPRFRRLWRFGRLLVDIHED